MLRTTQLTLFLMVFCGRCLAGVSFLSLFTFPSKQQFQRGSSAQTFYDSFIGSRTARNMILEVEQKFRIGDNQDINITDICSKLESLGYHRKGPTVTFADWYFDDLSSLSLSLQDCWLRYREMGDQGEWQLKRGRQQLLGNSSCRNDSTSKKSTVYEEIIGKEAVDMALSIIKCADSLDVSTRDLEEKEENDTMMDCIAPNLPTNQPHSLKAFVRLVTTRSSWVLPPSSVDIQDISENANIQVDLDITNTNYAVGEVETVVEREDHVPRAQALVQRTIEQLQGKKYGPPIGKLEHFLVNFRPKHYEELVRVGILKTER
jgi:CYTH domain